MALCVNTRAAPLSISCSGVGARRTGLESTLCVSRRLPVEPFKRCHVQSFRTESRFEPCPLTRRLASRTDAFGVSRATGEAGVRWQGRRASQQRPSGVCTFGRSLLGDVRLRPFFGAAQGFGVFDGETDGRREVNEGQGSSLGRIRGTLEKGVGEVDGSHSRQKRRKTTVAATLGEDGKKGTKEKEVSGAIRARWGRCVFPWLEKSIEFSPGAVLSSLAAYQAYFDACAGGEVVDDSDFVTAVESFFRFKGASVQHYKGIGGGAFRDIALVTPEVDWRAAQGRADGAVLNAERAQSGRAASTSASRSSSKGGRKQQAGKPPRTEEASAGELDVGNEEDWGRGVLNSLIGGQAAWLSGPLLVLASEKKNREAEEQNSALRERLRSLKEAAGLSNTEGGLKGPVMGSTSENEFGGGHTNTNRLHLGGEVGGSGDTEVASGPAGGTTGGKVSKRRVLTPGANGAVGKSGKRSVAVADILGEKLDTEADVEEPVLGEVSEREEEREVIHAGKLPKVDASETLTASESLTKSLTTLELRDTSETGAKKSGRKSRVGAKGPQLARSEIAAIANGVSREEFLLRLEGLEEGLGTRAENLIRESLVREVGADVLAETVSVNGSSLQLDGRVLQAAGTESKGSATAKQFSYRGDGMGSGAWSAAPSKLDANHAVAVMVARVKRVHMVKMQNRASGGRGDVSESDGELLGELEGENLAAFETPVQNGAVVMSAEGEMLGWEESRTAVGRRLEIDGLGDLAEGVSGPASNLENGSAAVRMSLQNGLSDGKELVGVAAEMEGVSARSQRDVPVTRGGSQNGFAENGAREGSNSDEAKLGLAANGAAPPGTTAMLRSSGESPVQNGAGLSPGESGAKPGGRGNVAVSPNGRSAGVAVDDGVWTNCGAQGLDDLGTSENGTVSDSRVGSVAGKSGPGSENGTSLQGNQNLDGQAMGGNEAGDRRKVNGTPIAMRSKKGLNNSRGEESDGSFSVGTADGAVSHGSDFLRMAECENSASEDSAGESAPVAAVGATGKEGPLLPGGGVGNTPLPPPLPVVRKRMSSRGMIARGRGTGGSSSGGGADGRGKTHRKPNEQPEESESPPMLVTASHKIGEEPPIATMAVDARGAYLAGHLPPGKKLSRNYTLEEDEKLFEELGFRLTGAELGRVEEWLRTRDVPELKLSRPRDRNGRYFVMPVIEKVERHLKAHGRLQREPDLPTTPVIVPGRRVSTPAAGPGSQGGENTDEFFRQMGKELSADVVSQTREQFEEGGKEKPKDSPPSEEAACFTDLFADDSSDSDVETLFAKAGLNGGDGQAEELTNLERVQIAEYLMGLNGPGKEPPGKQDWPCTPEGDRYSKETVRGIWRAADEMGGLDAFLTLFREEEKIERLLVETLCKGRLRASEDWRELDTDEKVAVDAMDPEERVTALEFMIAILDEGEPLDWKKHKGRWPRKMRSAHMMKSRLLLAVIKVAKRAGGLLEYLEESKKDVARKPVFIDEEEAPRTPSPFRMLDELLGGSDRDANSGEDSDSDGSWRAAIPKIARGKLRGAKSDPLLVSATASGGVVDWRESSYLRGVDPEANVPPVAGSRQPASSGGFRRADDRGTPTGPSKPPKRYSAAPDPDLDKSKIPRGFALRRRKGPPVRDNSLAFATWNNTTSTKPPPPPSPNLTPPKPPIPSPQLRKGGMIQSAAERAAASQFLFPGGDLPQAPTPPARERRWTGIYEPKTKDETEGPVQPQLENLSERDRELLSAPSGAEALRDLLPIERRRRRRLLGIKVQRHDDVDELSSDSGVFEVVGRQQRSMREILSGYAQETVLMRGEDLAQPVLVEDDLRSSEEGLLERLVSGHKSEVEEFKDTSKQYVRAWQDFQTWSDFFKFKNKRMPTVTDVEATCIPWLIDKAKAYVVLRKHMIMLAEGNEKLLTAMATIQAELNKRSTAPMAADRAAAYRARANLGAPKKPVKRKPRAKKGVTESDLVAGSIMDALDASEDEFE